MNTFMLSLIAVALLATPILSWLEARRLRRFAEARLGIARAVTQAERMMLDGTVKCGDACHDHVFAGMYRAQFIRKFPLPMSPRTEESKAIATRLRAELAGARSAASAPLYQFSASYMDALVTQNQAIYLLVGTSVFMVRGIRWNIRIVRDLRQWVVESRNRLAANSLANVMATHADRFAGKGSNHAFA